MYEIKCLIRARIGTVGSIGFALALLAIGCSSSPNEPLPGVQDLSQAWSTATATDVDMDAAGLARAVQKAEAVARFQSLLVVRRGMLVVEEYFHGNHADNLNDVRSVTKSVLSTLTGVALKEGFIGSLDETLGDYLHPRVAELDSQQRSISIRHLLTMTGGFLWDESGGFGSYSTWIFSEDHIQALLDQPFASSPGSNFTYNSAAVHLLGVLLQEAVGMPLPEFADRFLFSKIGIERSRWEPLTRGYVNGGAGIDLRPRDLARLGQLFLQNGRSGGDRVLPTYWVALATTPRFQWRSRFGALQAYTYGYLWWIEEGQTNTAFLAWGYGGQFIYVVADLELVVVATTNWQRVSQDGGAASVERAALDIIINDVVRSAE